MARSSRAAAKKASKEELIGKIDAVEWAIQRNLDSLIYIQNSDLIPLEIRERQVEAHRSYQGTLFQIRNDYKRELESRS